VCSPTTRNRTQDEWQQRQENEVGAVGDDQPNLPARDGRDLAPHAGMYRFAQLGRFIGLRQGSGPLPGLILSEEPSIGFVGVGAHLGEDLGPVGGSHRVANVVRRTAIGRLTPRRHQQQLVADIQVGQHVRHHDHHTARVGQLTQHRHDLVVQCGIQARGRLVEDQQRRPGEQFQGHRRPFALSAGQLVHPGVGVLGQVEFPEHLGDDRGPVGLAGIGR
jgi:hypothetical protein